MVVMAALAALSAGPVRLPRSWLWLPGAVPLSEVAGRLPSLQHVLGPVLGSPELDVLLLLAAAVVCWLVTDARPAFALCLAVLLGAVTTTLPDLVSDESLMSWALERSPPRKAYLLFEDHPARITPYTPRLPIDRM